MNYYSLKIQLQDSTPHHRVFHRIMFCKFTVAGIVERTAKTFYERVLFTKVFKVLTDDVDGLK